MDVKISTSTTTKCVANIASGDCFVQPDHSDRVFLVLYHLGLGNDASVCLCFRNGKPPERCELSSALPVREATFVSAEFAS
jgi:hypothetical protein